MSKPGAKSFTCETKVWKTKTKGMARLEWFWRHIYDEVLGFRPNLIMLEGYAYGVSRGNSAISMGELGGIVRYVLYQMGAPVVIIPPAKLKKFVTGRGNANKEIVMLEAYKRFAIDAPTTDEVEATALAIMAAVGVYDLKVDLPKKNLEALDDVEFTRA
jgi:Holliday junction resolvasome RuvABC endonuclease subunit